MGDSNVTAFPRFNLHNLSASLRKLADDIDSGERPAERAVIVMELTDGRPDYAVFGKDTTFYHALGMLAVCQHQMLEPDEEE